MDKKIYVTQSSMPTFEEYTSEIKDIWETRWLTNMGEKHRKLEKQLKEYLDVENISLMCNGHLALELALQAMHLSGEIITTPFTFASTTHAIVRCGLKPVFADINPDTYTIEPEEIERLVTDKTSAIVPVHVYGNICDVDAIDRIARKYGLKVIYDAAHTFGERYKGKSIARFGDASMFSFHATKVFNTIEGGAVCFEDPEYGEELYRLKNFGIRGPERVDAVGANAKMNEFQAAMGLCNLLHVDKEIEKRKKIYECYVDNLKNIPGIKLCEVQDDVEPNYAYFPIVIEEKIFGATRNEVNYLLEQQGIYTRKYFYPLTNTFDCYKTLYNVTDTPVALHIAKRVLTLPLYADLSVGDAENICNMIKQIGEEK